MEDMRRTSEPPPGYVAFVAAHLERLRRDAAAVVGDERDADRLYPDVLTDVAVRWNWLQVLGDRLGRTGVVEGYLRRAFDKRSQRWYAARTSDDLPWTPVEVWPGDGPPPPPSCAEDPESPPPEPSTTPPVTSMAARISPLVASGVSVAGPVAEAAIAWWHAYETHRRYKIGAVVGFIALLILLVARFAAPYPDTY